MAPELGGMVPPGHAERVATLASAMGEQLGLPRAERPRPRDGRAPAPPRAGHARRSGRRARRRSGRGDRGDRRDAARDPAARGGGRDRGRRGRRPEAPARGAGAAPRERVRRPDRARQRPRRSRGRVAALGAVVRLRRTGRRRAGTRAARPGQRRPDRCADRALGRDVDRRSAATRLSPGSVAVERACRVLGARSRSVGVGPRLARRCGASACGSRCTRRRRGRRRG